MKTKEFRVLILEDRPEERPMWVRSIKQVFAHPYNTDFKCDVLEAADGQEFDLRVGRLGPGEKIDLVLLDQVIRKHKLVDGKYEEVTGSEDSLEQGSDILKRFAHHPAIKKMIVLTANVEGHPELTRISQGAHEYWSKQGTGFEVFRDQIESIFGLPSRYDINRFDAAIEANGINLTEVKDYFAWNLIGEHPLMLRVKAQICEASLTDIPVIITGETGTGKEEIAKLIHTFSRRGHAKGSAEPFSLNCAEFVEEQLLRSEVFGHKKGAFTGAVADKQGLLFAADKSTVFLDEVGLAPESLQGLLLRAFEEKKACPVGGIKKEAFDVRFIAATDQPVFGSPAERFSRAFLHRLCGMHIHIPTLRERRTDIRLLVNHFMKDVSLSARITEAAWRLLETYDWPGNVRQLKYLVDLLAARCKLTKQPMITRYDCEALLPGAEQGAGTSATAETQIDAYLVDGIGYEQVKARFLADYVHRQHQKIGYDERSNEAYQKTAEALGCSVSTVKERLRDYQRLFNEAREDVQDE